MRTTEHLTHTIKKPGYSRNMPAPNPTPVEVNLVHFTEIKFASTPYKYIFIRGVM